MKAPQKYIGMDEGSTYNVEAIQWTGDNMQEVKSFVGEELYRNGTTLENYDRLGKNPEIFLGEWIVRQEGYSSVNV
jgi:hypothetical protein